MSINGGNKPKGVDESEDNLKIIEDAEVVAIPEEGFGGSKYDSHIKEGYQSLDRILYPSEIDHILNALNNLVKKSEDVIRQIQQLKRFHQVADSEDLKKNDEVIAAYIKLKVTEMKRLQSELLAYVQVCGIDDNTGRFATLNKGMRDLVSIDGISESALVLLLIDFEGLISFFEDERGKGVQNPVEQGGFFSLHLSSLTEEIKRNWQGVWSDKIDLIQGNLIVMSKLQEIEKIINALKKNTETTPYLKINVIDPILKIINGVGKSIQGVIDLKDIDINSLERFAKQLVNFFKSLSVENAKKTIDVNEIMRNIPIVTSLKKSDPLETQRKVDRIRNLWKRGDRRGAMILIEEFALSHDAYQRLWDPSNKKKRSFMIEKETMHPIVENFLKDFAVLDSFQKKFPNGVSVLELGPGIGNDALNWFKYLPNLRYYAGIDVSENAAGKARERIKTLLAGHKPANLNYWSVEVGDFVKRVQAIAEGLSSIGVEAPNNTTTVITSISTLHYFWQPVFKEILRSIHEILYYSRGYLVMAIKTPESDSFKEHEVIESAKGYELCFHPDEGIVRAFMTPKEINRMLDEKGFDMKNATTFPKVVEGYDFPGQKEVFHNVIVQPKKLPKNS